jgi:hypothetical protein
VKSPIRREDTAERLSLEPNVLPAQRRALDRLATRLSTERPVPDPAFRAELDARIHDLAPSAPGFHASRWRLWTWACLLSGLALLGLAVLLVVLGEPGGH